MLKKVQAKLNVIREEITIRSEERARIAREMAEEKARKENERFQVEKDALMELSEKELMVETIMALKGYNTRLNIVEKQQNDLQDRINSLQSNLSSLDSSVHELKDNEFRE